MTKLFTAICDENVQHLSAGLANSTRQAKAYRAAFEAASAQGDPRTSNREEELASIRAWVSADFAALEKQLLDKLRKEMTQDIRAGRYRAAEETLQIFFHYQSLAVQTYAAFIGVLDAHLQLPEGESNGPRRIMSAMNHVRQACDTFENMRRTRQGKERTLTGTAAATKPGPRTTGPIPANVKPLH